MTQEEREIRKSLAALLFHLKVIGPYAYLTFVGPYSADYDIIIT